MNETQEMVVAFEYQLTQEQYRKYIWQCVRKNYRYGWLFVGMLPLFFYFVLNPLDGSASARTVSLINRLLCMFWGAAAGIISFYIVMVYWSVISNIKRNWISQAGQLDVIRMQVTVTANQFVTLDCHGIHSQITGRVALVKTENRWQVMINDIFNCEILLAGINEHTTAQLELLRLSIEKKSHPPTVPLGTMQV